MMATEQEIYKILEKYHKLRGTIETPLFSDRECVREILCGLIPAELTEVKEKDKKCGLSTIWLDGKEFTNSGKEESDCKKIKKETRRAVLEEVEEEFTKIWNIRSEKLQDPDRTDCKDFSSEAWYKSKYIDNHDNSFWNDYLLMIKKLKKRNLPKSNELVDDCKNCSCVEYHQKDEECPCNGHKGKEQLEGGKL